MSVWLLQFYAWKVLSFKWGIAAHGLFKRESGRNALFHRSYTVRPRFNYCTGVASRLQRVCQLHKRPRNWALCHDLQLFCLPSRTIAAHWDVLLKTHLKLQDRQHNARADGLGRRGHRYLHQELQNRSRCSGHNGFFLRRVGSNIVI